MEIKGLSNQYLNALGTIGDVVLSKVIKPMSSVKWGLLAHSRLGLRTIITKSHTKKNLIKKIIPLKLTKIK